MGHGTTRDVVISKKDVAVTGCLILSVIFLLGGCGREEVETTSKVEDDIVKVAPPSGSKEADGIKEEGIEPRIEEAIKNTPPKIVSIKLTPRLVYPGTKIKALVEAIDEDGDPISFEYRWKRNDKLLHEEVLDELDTTGFKKGDFITLTVTPFDGKERGMGRTSLPLIIANRPPEITSTPSLDVTDGKYIYEVKAKDDDGDPLSFSLEESPPGMTIDPVTGVIEWGVPPESDGVFQIKIVVTDGDAKAFQGFSLNLKRQ